MPPEESLKVTDQPVTSVSVTEPSELLTSSSKRALGPSTTSFQPVGTPGWAGFDGRYANCHPRSPATVVRAGADQVVMTSPVASAMATGPIEEISWVLAPWASTRMGKGPSVTWAFEVDTARHWYVRWSLRMPAPTLASALPVLTAAEADQRSLGWPVARFSISKRT